MCQTEKLFKREKSSLKLRLELREQYQYVLAQKFVIILPLCHLSANDFIVTHENVANIIRQCTKDASFTVECVGITESPCKGEIDTWSLEGITRLESRGRTKPFSNKNCTMFTWPQRQA